VKNLFHESFIHGLHDIDTVKYLLSTVGGWGIALHFPRCPDSLDIELKFATVFENDNNIQVWRMFKSGWDFKPSFRNLQNEASMGAYFTRYIHEVYGDHAQTQLLAANYSNITAKRDVVEVNLGDVKAATTRLEGI
jgi:hypothetical protein